MGDWTPAGVLIAGAGPFLLAYLCVLTWRERKAKGKWPFHR